MTDIGEMLFLQEGAKRLRELATEAPLDLSGKLLQLAGAFDLRAAQIQITSEAERGVSEPH